MTTYIPVPWPLLQKLMNIAFAFRELQHALIRQVIPSTEHDASVILADLENLPIPADRIDLLPLMEYHITWQEDYFRRTLRNGFRQLFLARSQDQFATLVARWVKSVMCSGEVTVQLGADDRIMIDEGSTAIGRFTVERPSFSDGFQ